MSRQVTICDRLYQWAESVALNKGYRTTDEYVCDLLKTQKTTSNLLLDAGITCFAKKPLSLRELDVARLLVQGLPNKRIATTLKIEVVTVKLHIKNICQKFNATNRTQAALAIQAFGLHRNEAPLQ